MEQNCIFARNTTAIMYAGEKPRGRRSSFRQNGAAFLARRYLSFNLARDTDRVPNKWIFNSAHLSDPGVRPSDEAVSGDQLRCDLDDTGTAYRGINAIINETDCESYKLAGFEETPLIFHDV